MREILTSQTKRIWEWFSVILGTGLGVGFFPILPGTVGSLWGPLGIWGLKSLQLHSSIEIAIAVAVFVVGVPICSSAASFLRKKDPGSVIFDEFAAFYIVLLPIPLSEWHWGWVIAGFVLFRVFDIVKPWPVKLAEKPPKGWGIMLDDQVAAVYAALSLWLAMSFF